MKSDFERWLAAQFVDSGPFTLFIVLVRIGERDVRPVRSSFAQMIGDEMPWPGMLALLDGAGTPWDGVGFFVGLGYAGGPLPDTLAREKLKKVEAAVLADPLHLNQGRLFDRLGRHIQIDEVS